MANETKPLAVIFRMFRNELCAYFPNLPWAPGQITCYAHVGQHGGACPSWLRKGRPALPSEYVALLAELRGIYETNDAEHVPLVVRTRASCHH